MKRCLFAAIVLSLSTAPVAVAQVHPGQHDRNRPHGPGHAPYDSATHARLHSLLSGGWEGTFHRPNDTTHALFMRVSHDSAHGVSLAMKSDKLKGAGPARGLMFAAGVVQWTQDVSGVPCKASARVDTTTKTTRTMTGKLACPKEEIAFTLRKQAQ